jgi:hypothetical protein
MEQNSYKVNSAAWERIADGARRSHPPVDHPEHWARSCARPVFSVVGIAQIVWGIALWRRPSTRLYYVGVLMAGWLIVH